MPRRRLEFRFYIPPTIYGMYDTSKGIMYIFGNHEIPIEDVINHETLHWTVQKVAGKQASLDLDNVKKYIKVESI